MRLLHALVGLFGVLLMACAPVDASTPTDDGPVVITLTRGACFGFCPVYTVSITGDGQVGAGLEGPERGREGDRGRDHH